MMALPSRTELRRDPTSGRWVLVRNGTPRPKEDGSCPFCPGHEAYDDPPPSEEPAATSLPKAKPAPLPPQADDEGQGGGIWERVRGETREQQERER
jgi:hypothetical protein